MNGNIKIWKTLRQLSLVVGVFSVLATGGCGGGGGGGGGGSTESQATLSTINAAALIADIMGSGDGSQVVVLTVTTAQQGTSGGHSVSSARELSQRLKTVYEASTSLTVAPATSERFAPAFSVDDLQSCPFGGTVHYTGTINDIDFTGTLNATYTDCVLEDGFTYNGQGTLTVTVFDLFYFVPTDFTFTASNLTVTGPGVNLTLGGSLRDQLNIAGNTETTTFNTVTTDNIAVKTIKAHNLVWVFLYDNILSPSSYTVTITGRLWDSDYGYVDVSPVTPFVFASISQLFPNSGQHVLVGTGTVIRVTALSSVLLTVELDLNGDTAYELTAYLRWIDIDGPIAADLGDDDGDGMHNSWETFYGLNPSDPSDAAVDTDSDGSTNLQEYQAGTDPTVP